MWHNVCAKKLTLVLLLLCLTGCFPTQGSEYPTPPATLPELIAVLQSDNEAAHITAALALGNMGAKAEPAVPALIKTLRSDRYEVRRVTADALGKIGPGAWQAIPALIDTLQNDDGIQIRRNAAKALGAIGDTTAVPALASILYKQDALDDKILAINSAMAIARITGEISGADSIGYGANAKGDSLLVIAVREWWEKEGQFKEWLPVATSIPESTPTPMAPP